MRPDVGAAGVDPALVPDVGGAHLTARPKGKQVQKFEAKIERATGPDQTQMKTEEKPAKHFRMADGQRCLRAKGKFQAPAASKAPRWTAAHGCGAQPSGFH